MSTKQENKAKREKAIFEDHNRMFNIELKRPDVIYKQLGEKYFLTPDTIARIVSRQARLPTAAAQTLPFEPPD